eukprot:3225398-Rhodomonas_salina.1
MSVRSAEVLPTRTIILRTVLRPTRTTIPLLTPYSSSVPDVPYERHIIIMRPTRSTIPRSVLSATRSIIPRSVLSPTRSIIPRSVLSATRSSIQ